MWKKIVFSFIILCFIITTTGCGGGLTVPSTQEPSDDFILIQVKDTESNISFIAGEKNGDTVTILGEKNSQGDPAKITGTLYVSEQGDAIFLEAGIDGLPSYKIDSEGNKITFENYTNSTVDIALYGSNENLIEGPITIDVNPQDLLEIKQLYNSSNLKQKYMPWWGNFIDVQFDWALNVLTFASNNSGIIFDESGNPVDYTKPWEIEVNISDLLPEDNFIIIYEALLPVFIVDDLFDWVSFIWDVIAYIYQDEEILTPEEIELIREWGYGGDYVVRWPDGYVDVYDATNYSQMQGILNQWNAAIGGPVILRLSSNPNCPVKVIFDSNIGQEGYCWYVNNQEGDDYTFSEVMIKINYDESFCGYPNTTYTAYLCAFNAVAGFNYWAEVSLTPLDDWNNFNTIPDTIKTMVHALYKVSPGYYLGDSKQWKNRSNAIIKNIFKSGGGSYLDSDRK